MLKDSISQTMPAPTPTVAGENKVNERSRHEHQESPQHIICLYIFVLPEAIPTPRFSTECPYIPFFFLAYARWISVSVICTQQNTTIECLFSAKDLVSESTIFICISESHQCPFMVIDKVTFFLSGKETKFEK